MSFFNLSHMIGPEDLSLIGNPQISYFSSVFRRPSPFDLYSDVLPETPGSSEFKISSSHHLLKSVALQTVITYSANITIQTNIGTTILDNISYRFGDNSTVFEKLSGSYIEIYNQLHTPLNVKSQYIKNGSYIEVVPGNKLNTLSYSGGVFNVDTLKSEEGDTIKTILPIPFSFSQNIGDSLPIFLIDPDNKLTFKVVNNVNSNDFTIEQKLICDFIHLDEEELQRFKKSPNQYIYTMVIEPTMITTNNTFTMDLMEFKHVKTIIWKNIRQMPQITISVNNVKYVDNLDWYYFSRLFPMKAGLPGCGRSIENKKIYNDDSICYYTFGLKEGTAGEENTSNGSVNSSLNQIILTGLGNTEVYFLCYNIVTFSLTPTGSGMTPVIKGGNQFS